MQRLRLFSAMNSSESKQDARTTTSVAVIQSVYPGSAQAAVAHADAEVRRAAEMGAKIICLQEIFAGPYFCQSEDDACFALAETIPGPTTGHFCELAGELGVVIVVPLFERVDAGIFYNSAAIIDADGSLLGTYRKMHIPDDPQFYEKYYFAPGDGGFRAWQTRWGKIGVLICWDQWFPEAARLTAMAGAEVIFYPTAIGCIPEDRGAVGAVQRDSWQTMQRSHAIANGCYVAAANRIGLEQGPDGAGIEFWGHSFIVDPTGKVVAQAGGEAEEILVAEIDRQVIEKQRVHWPFFRDRRIDAYSGLTRRYGSQREGENGTGL